MERNQTRRCSMTTMNALMKHRHGLSVSTHHRLGYPLAGWFSPEPTSVSPSNLMVPKVTSNTTRYALKNLGGLGAGPQVRLALRKGIRKSFSESVLTKNKTVAIRLEIGWSRSASSQGAILRWRSRVTPPQSPASNRVIRSCVKAAFVQSEVC